MNRVTKEQRRRLAEERRLASLSQRRKENEEKLKAIREGLSGGGTISSSHVLFDDSENEKETDSFAQRSGEAGKITGKAAADWLGLAGDDSDGDDVVLQNKPHLDGKGGQKLMAIQRRIGPDKRFEITEAFAESEDDGEEDDQVDESEQDYEKERVKSLMILQSVLGNGIITTKRKQRSNLDMKRYDPNMAGAAEMVILPSAVEEKKKVSIKATAKVESLVDTGPQVSKKKFYSVSSDFKLSSTKPFSFSDMFSENLPTNAEHEVMDEIMIPSDEEPDKFTHLYQSPVDSSSDEGEVEARQESPTVQMLPAASHESEGFFFLTEEPNVLRGRLANGVQSFVRTKTIEEIESEWRESRAMLTQDYKKKWKDATRQRNKSKQKNVFKKESK
eukprot:m.1348 g.1348  ORF g.1348 m.1348 type:complete len:389 (+) comp6250_c0_seq1:11-1177(+)